MQVGGGKDNTKEKITRKLYVKYFLEMEYITSRKIAFVVGSKRFFSSVFDPTLTLNQTLV